MKAYTLPSNQIRAWNTYESITPKNWSLEKGFYDSGWGYATTEIFPVQSGKKFICSVGKSGTTIDAVIQIANIIWLKAVYNEDIGEDEYIEVEKISPSWHVTNSTGTVPPDVNCAVIKMNCADINISSASWKKLFEDDELALSFTLYNDADITEVQLNYRSTVNLELTKDKVIYDIDDTLNVDDIGVVQIYNDGFIKTLSSDEYTINTTNVDMSTVGIYNIVITAVDSGISGTITLYVGDVLMGISTSSLLSSKVGNNIDTSNLIVTASYTDGTSKEVSGYTVDTSLVDNTVEGEYTITITYTENGFTATCETTYLVYSKLLVSNIAAWSGSTSDDAREYGWTMEKPNHISLSSYQSYMYPHILTDADFMCMDVTDNAGTNLTDRNLFIPMIGKTDGRNISISYNSVITSSNINNGNLNFSSNYPVSQIVDSLGRGWYKIQINGNILNGDTHKCVLAKSNSLNIYYCDENNLGDFESQRLWE